MPGNISLSMKALTVAIAMAGAASSSQLKPRALGDSLKQGRASVPAVKLPQHKQLNKRIESTTQVGGDWYIEAWIGTPGSKFYFLADSGAPNFSVESTLEPADVISDVPLYNPDNSTTAQLKEGYTYSECYGSGYCDNGVVYTDIVTIGQLAFEGMPIMVQTNHTEPSSGIRSGTLGLNVDRNGMSTEPERVPSYFMTILDSLDAPLWTVDFQAANETGVFAFGYIDESKYKGDIAYGGVTTTDGLWNVEIQGIGAGYDDSAFRAHPFQVCFDTGTGGGSITKNVADLYWSQIPNAQWSDDWNNYLYPCNQTLPDFVIQLEDGHKVGIPSNGLFAKEADDGSGMCSTMLAIAEGESDDTLWGQIWIEKWFVIFDWGNNRLGVANKDQ